MESQNSTMQDTLLVKENYSDKSFVVYGPTKKYKDDFGNLGGRFNKNLTIGGETVMGWVFSKKAQEKVMEFVSRVNSGEVISSTSTTSSEIPIEGSASSGLPTVSVPNSNNGSFQYVKFKIYKPSVGQKVNLKADGKTTEGKVIRVESHNDIVDTVYVDFNGATSLAMICGQEWKIFGYGVRHSIFFSN